MRTDEAAPWVWLNGRFLPGAEAMVSAGDRGFLYGDGLFETVAVHGGRPFLWEEHWNRFASGTSRLGIQTGVARPTVEEVCRDLLQKNLVAEGILRMTVSRGPGPRGYSPRGAGPPTFLIQCHSLDFGDFAIPRSWKLVCATHRVPCGSEVARIKSISKLLQVMARAEAEERSASDALLLNTEGRIAECASANFFCIRNGVVITPPVEEGCLPGITRDWVLRACATNRIPCEEGPMDIPTALVSGGCFASLTGPGIVEITEIEGVPIPSSEITRCIHQLYRSAVELHR